MMMTGMGSGMFLLIRPGAIALETCPFASEK